MTPLIFFYVTLRVLLGDLDAEAFAYSDSALANALRAAMRMNCPT